MSSIDASPAWKTLPKEGLMMSEVLHSAPKPDPKAEISRFYHGNKL